MTFHDNRWFRLALLAASALMVFGCLSSRETAREQTRSPCAKSARAAYQAGKLVCARQLAKNMSNPVSRHEIRAYVHFKFGNLEKGVSELSRAVALLEQRRSALSREHRLQLKRLKTRLSVFRSVRQYRLQKTERGPSVADSSTGRGSPRQVEGWGGKQSSGQGPNSE